MKKYNYYIMTHPLGSSITGGQWILRRREVELVAETDSSYKIRYHTYFLENTEEWIIKSSENKLEEIIDFRS